MRRNELNSRNIVYYRKSTENHENIWGRTFYITHYDKWFLSEAGSINWVITFENERFVANKIESSELVVGMTEVSEALSPMLAMYEIYY